jgi:hypothetical protein
MHYPKIDPPRDTPPDFYNLFGQFHAVWLANDTLIDYAIYQLLGTAPLDTHIILSGMMFGAKSRLLLALVKRSDHKNKNDLLDAVGKIQAAKRDVFSHSYLYLDSDNVLFIERTKGGKYGTVEHHFTNQEFRQHVANFIQAGQKFQNALAPDEPDLLAFVKAADPKAAQSAVTSPQESADKK